MGGGVLAYRGNYGYVSGRLRWIRHWMKLQDQHKLHCRPKHVFPQCFGVYIYDMCSSLSFLLSLAGQPQAGPRSWFSEDVGACLKCCFAIWGASAGRRSRTKKKDWIRKQKKNKKKTTLYLGKKGNSNPLWQTDARCFLPVMTGSWASN